MKRLLSLIVFIFTLHSNLLSQVIEENNSIIQIIEQEYPAYCGFDVIKTKYNNKDAEKLEQSYYEAMQFSSLNNLKSDYTVPVVVHIIHTNGAENITDEQVLDGLEHLNQAFANTGYYNPSIGVSTSLQFCLASQDPTGNATTGINRIVSDLTMLTLETEDLDLKNLIRWDPLNYINIWLVKEICSNSVGCGVAGYAYLPNAHGTAVDGLVVEARWMGSNEANSSVLVHELGHYFGLRHTFQGGCNNQNCLLDGDQVCDTRPDQNTASAPCDANVNSCSTDVNLSDENNPFTSDEGEHFWNYMDYGDWNCYAEFTQGQSNRMDFFLTEVRSSLLSSSACLSPCSTPIIVSFTASELNINVGETISFSNLSENAITYEWLMDGLIFSNEEHTSLAFLAEGRFDITLKASSEDPLCLIREYTLVINVNCPSIATISTDNTEITPGETVNFNSVVNDADTYTWYINGDVVGSQTVLDYTFNEGGYFEVFLIVSNEYCSHRSNSIVIEVDAPCDTYGFNLGLTTYDYSEIFKSMELLNDGGVIIVGKDFMTRKDANLNELWFKEIRSEEPSLFQIPKIKVLDSDEGFLLTGGHRRMIDPGIIHRIAAIRKVNLDGEVLWNIFIDDVYSSFIDLTVIETTDGNFIAIGDGEIQSPRGDCYVVKFNSEGEILWHKGYIEPAFSRSQFKNGFSLPDGSMILTGWASAQGLSTSSKLWVCKLDVLGNIVWSKIYVDNLPHDGSNFGSFETSIPSISDSSFILVSKIETDMPNQNYSTFFMEISLNGMLINSRVEMIPEELISLSAGISMRTFKSHDDNILVLRKHGEYDYLYKIDQSLNMLWGRKYFLPVGFFELVELTDNTILLSGGNVFDKAGLLRLDENGFAPSCFINTITPGELEVDFQVEDLAIEVINDPLTFTNVAYNLEDVSTTSEKICPPPAADLAEAKLNFKSARTYQDNMAYEIEICNTGNTVTNAAMPISFYTANPTEQAADLIDVLQIGQNIQPGECITINMNSNALTSSELIYAILNDNGTLNPIFSLIDFPVTTFPECNFFDNLDFAENALCEAPLLDLGEDKTICNNTSVELNAGEANTYLWSTGATDSVIIIEEAGIYWVKAIGICGAEWDTITVNNYDFISLDLGQDIMDCENKVQVLDAGDHFTSYLWSDLSMDQSITTFLAGEYWLEATDVCGFVQYDTIRIGIIPTSILELGPDTSFCSGDTIRFSIAGFEEYNWSFVGSFDCHNCDNMEIRPRVSSTYTLIASNSDGCISVDSIHLELLNIEDCILANGDDYIFEISPNPSSGSFEVHLNLPKDIKYELRVYNVLGQLVARKYFLETPKVIGFNLNSSPSGMYLVQLVSERIKATKKVLLLNN